MEAASKAFVMVTMATASSGKVSLESKSVILKQGTPLGHRLVPHCEASSHSTNCKVVPRVDCS